jgi:S1-C subfamily serine protease
MEYRQLACRGKSLVMKIIADKCKRIVTSLLLVSTYYSAIGQTAVEVAKKCMGSTVSIIAVDSEQHPIALGSGFIIGTGKVITNVHVIEGASSAIIKTDNSDETHEGTQFIQIDRQNDLILILVPTLKSNALEINSIKLPEIGSRIFAIGNPRGLNGTISEGIVSGVRTDNNRDLFQISAPISPGSSGGPILNENGELIGVSVSSITSGQNLNFAIPVKYVDKLISATSQTPILLTSLKKPVSQIKSQTEGVFLTNFNWRENPYGRYNQYLNSFSVTNKTNKNVCCIEIIALVYQNGEVSDYFEFTLFSNDTYSNTDFLGTGPIKAHLGKTIMLSDWSNEDFRCRYENDFCFSKNSEESVEFKILNYQFTE